jgi:hypothetical protein
MSTKRSQKELAYEFSQITISDECHDVLHDAAERLFNRDNPSGKLPSLSWHLKFRGIDWVMHWCRTEDTGTQYER